MGEIQGIDDLRKFHNWIKFQMIKSAKHQTNGKYLLDVAVGRGGDIFKWAKNNLKSVTGIDNDSKSIYEKKEFDGAIQRYNNIRSQMYVPRCYFWNISATDPNVLRKLNIKDNYMLYDIVSCQFSFHYLLNDIDITLHMISNKLEIGGLFIGTASDGDLISQRLETGNIETPILKIEKIDDKSYNYILKPGGTSRTTYFEFRGALPEYILNKDTMINKCKMYNLELVRMLNFHEWKNIYNGNLSNYEMEASFFNFSFVFKKITGDIVPEVASQESVQL